MQGLCCEKDALHGASSKTLHYVVFALRSYYSKYFSFSLETKRSLQDVIRDIKNKFPSDFDNVAAAMGLDSTLLTCI